MLLCGLARRMRLFRPISSAVDPRPWPCRESQRRWVINHQAHEHTWHDIPQEAIKHLHGAPNPRGACRRACSGPGPWRLVRDQCAWPPTQWPAPRGGGPRRCRSPRPEASFVFFGAHDQGRQSLLLLVVVVDSHSTRYMYSSHCLIVKSRSSNRCRQSIHLGLVRDPGR